MNTNDFDVEDYRSRLRTPSVLWNKENDVPNLDKMFETEVRSLYYRPAIIKVFNWKERLRRRLFLYFYFTKHDRLSEFVYKRLYDECEVAKVIFYAKPSTDDKHNEMIDKEIKLEVPDLTKLKPNLTVECDGSEEMSAIVHNPKVS